MGFKIAEFFAELGVVGSEKSVEAVGGVLGAMDGLTKTSLEAKAAIVGAFYALEQMFAASGNVGTSLRNFTALTGISAIELQRYQYAARQVGGTNEEVAKTFTNLQGVVSRALLGQSPKGIGLIAPTVGMTDEQFWGSMKDPKTLFQVLQKFVQSNVAPGIRNEILRGFGLSDAMIPLMAQNAFRPEVLARAPVYSEKETEKLQRNAAAWGNLGNKIEMAIGHFNALHGGEIVTDIDKITTAILKLLTAVNSLGDKLGVFNKTGKKGGLSSLVDIMTGQIGSVTTLLGDPTNAAAWTNIIKNSLIGLPIRGAMSFPMVIHQHFTGMDPSEVGKAASDGAHQGTEQAFRQLYGPTGGN